MGGESVNGSINRWSSNISLIIILIIICFIVFLLLLLLFFLVFLLGLVRRQATQEEIIAISVENDGCPPDSPKERWIRSSTGSSSSSRCSCPAGWVEQ
jgi:hypothetical protein